MTTLHIVLGELAPKSIALQRPEGTSLIVARPTTWFLRIFRPVIFMMNTIGNSVVWLMGFNPASGHEQVHSAEELLMLVESAHEAGMLDDSEERLLQRVFDFADIPIRDVMQPRVEVTAIAADAPLSEVLEKVSTGTYSRYPVFDESIDNVVGLLHTKDLLDLVVHNPALLSDQSASVDLRSILRDPLYFPELASVDRVLDQMQRAQTHFCVVLDEFGGMSGIATMEDILEELVGEVQDEFDSEKAPFSMGKDVIELDGLVTMHDVIERLGPLAEASHLMSSTIGGYVAERLDRIPAVGDKVTYGIYDVIVDEMDEMRVARVRLVRRNIGPNPADSSSDAPKSPTPAPES